MIEFMCQVDGEIELRISRPHRRRLFKDHKAALGQISVQGADKRLADTLLTDPEGKIMMQDLLAQFHFLYFGKDGQMRLLKRYDSALTDPNQIFSIFEKMIKLNDLLMEPASH